MANLYLCVIYFTFYADSYEHAPNLISSFPAHVLANFSIDPSFAVIYSEAFTRCSPLDDIPGLAKKPIARTQGIYLISDEHSCLFEHGRRGDENDSRARYRDIKQVQELPVLLLRKH